MKNKILAILILCSIQVLVEARVRSSKQFQDWYPEYAQIFTRIRDDNCSTEFQNYLEGKSDISIKELKSQGGSEHSRFVHPVILCILDNTNEYIKAALSSAQVILGLTPTILAIMGPSSEEFGVLSVIGARPILAFLLAIGAPAVFSSRAYEMVKPQDILRRRQDAFLPHNSTHNWGRKALVFFEYLAVLTALANVGVVSYELGIRTANPISGNFVFFPAVWVAMALPIHLVSIGLVRLNAKRKSKYSDSRGFWARELCLSEQPKFKAVYRKETKFFVAGSWTHSTFIVLQLVYGTIVFSSMQFIGQGDAAGVLGRYMGSVLVCRMVLMQELAFLSKGYEGPYVKNQSEGSVSNEYDDGKDSSARLTLFEGAVKP